MELFGKPTGNCIHCYEHQGQRLCSINDWLCDEDSEHHCVNFTARDEEEEEDR